MDNKLLTGQENFTCEGKNLGINILDFWRHQFSNIYDMQDELAEFVVSKALGIDTPYNKDYWTLYDIRYDGYRIEVKETAYFHSFNSDEKSLRISNQRVFGIPKKDGSNYPEDAWVKPNLERQSDLYVFCLIKGKTAEESYPLNMDNWEFYVMLTRDVNKIFKDQKTVSLSRVQEEAISVSFTGLKQAVDELLKTIPEDSQK